MSERAGWRSAMRVDGFARYPAHASAERRTVCRAPASPRAPRYARVLRLGTIRPGGLLCFLFFEGMIILGALLALAEFTSWWVVPVLPVTVALMVKFNDLVAVSPPPARDGYRSTGPGSAWDAPTTVLPIRAVPPRNVPAGPALAPPMDRGQRNGRPPIQAPVPGAAWPSAPADLAPWVVHRPAAGTNQRSFDRRVR